MSTDEDVAAATVDNVGVVTVTAIKRGSAVITVTAEGPTAASSTLTRSVSAPATRQNIAEYSFMVNVANRAPTVKATISAQTLPVGESTESEDLGEYFEDPDDDVLTYTSTSSNTNVAIAVVNGTFGTVVAVAVGTATITVTARDPDPGGLSATQTFTVTVSAVSAPEPDLISSISVSDSTLTTGATFTLRATVSNRGTGSSAATTLTYYRSSDSTITTGDTPIGTQSVSALDATSGAGREPISLIAPSSEGTYYYGACVDLVSRESDTTNNCSTAVTVTVTAPVPVPDLIVSSILASTYTLTLGTTFTLSATVENQGTGSSAATTLTYYLNVGLPISGDNLEVGTAAVSSLAAFETQEITISLTAPRVSGMYYYGACVVPVSTESYTRNNCSDGVPVTVTVPEPYLTISSISASTYTLPIGATFTLRATVENQGTGSSARTDLEYYLSTDSTIPTTDDTVVGIEVVESLAASETSPRSISLTAPSSSGTYYYGACVVNTVFSRSITTLNCSDVVRVTVEEPLTPDLIISGSSVSPTTVTIGDSFTFSVTVRNPGSSESSSATLRYYISTDSSIPTGDTQLGTDTVDPLPASGTSTESISSSAESVGTYYLGACLDSCSTTVQTTVQLIVAAPDLIISSSSASPSTVTTGNAFTFHATVSNQGGGRAPSTALRYYRSRGDSSISTRDAAIGTDAVSALAASAVSSSSISLTAPIQAGTYYYGACVDSVSSELNTGNNCSTAVTVTVEGVPDLIISSSSAYPQVSSIEVGFNYGFNLMSSVRNQGSGRSSSTTLRYYLSPDSTISPVDTQLGTDSVIPLPANSVGPTEHILLFTPSSAGTYYYGACVDSVRGELNTDNNCSTTGIRVAIEEPLELSIINVSVDNSKPKIGDSFTLYATVLNPDTRSSSPSAILTYYRSTDSTISTDDTQVGTNSVRSLSAFDTSAKSITLDAPNSAGTYYYGACLDSCSTAVRVTVEALPERPNLVISSISVSDSTLITATSFTLSATVLNQGSGRSFATTLRYYRSTDSTISRSGTDIQVGSDSVRPLSALDTSAESITLAAPSSAGTYYYGACLDSCSTAVRVTVETPPDLIISSSSVSDSTLITATSFTLDATVLNQGSGEASSTTLRYYRSTDSTISTGDTQVGTDSVSSLSFSGSFTGHVSLTAPSSVGTYYYGACVDPVPGELYTGNNCSTAVAVAVTVTVVEPSAPDLSIFGISVSNLIPETSASLTFSAVVINDGTGVSAATTLRYFRSFDSTISTSDIPVGTDEVSALETFESSFDAVGLDITLTAPDSVGTYYYGACVDSVATESDTTNNCSTAVTVTVVAPGTPVPDLIISSITVSPSTVTTRAPFTLSATVENRGTGASAATTLEYYRVVHTSATITSTTLEYTGPTGAVDPLSASDSSVESISLTASFLAGTYYYEACVVDVFGESDTNNNCSDEIMVTVVEPSAPDLIISARSVSNANPEASASFTFSATVRNQGIGASAATTLRYYRSFDATISTSDLSVGTYAVSALAASATSSESITLTAPSSAGTYYYGVCVDTVSTESDTTNNCSTAVTVTVEPSSSTCRVGQVVPTGGMCTLTSPVLGIGGNTINATSSQCCVGSTCSSIGLSFGFFSVTKVSSGCRINSL